MILSWNEIRRRAIEFSNEWKNEKKENAEAKSFWNDFFNVFGIKRRRIASFEEPVKKVGEKLGFIDLFWRGMLIVEHKSRGKNLDKAYSQAIKYFEGLRESELPKYVIVSDFNNIRLYNLEEGETNEFQLKDFIDNIHLFGFIAGYNQKKYIDEPPVNIKASELMGKLHDALKDNGFYGHSLGVFLVRVMFCLFAEDTGIFERGDFTEQIEKNTREDGADLGSLLINIFQILNTPINRRQKNLDEKLWVFPYVNGKLFEEKLDIPYFNAETRKILLDCCYFDWSKVSPAIFGSLFQAVMDKEKRSEIGAFYTSEKNILKCIKPLFLDKLYNEFHNQIRNRIRLEKLIDKITNLKFLDPACGCGNFLIIAYRELRILQLKIYKQIYRLMGISGQMTLDINILTRCIDVDSMYGIEKEEFPSRIAQVALWLIDHQMNMEMSQEFGEYFIRLPLRKTANIIIANALTLDWMKINSEKDFNFIFGNPPFIAKHKRNIEQNNDMSMICEKIKGYTVLDYVCAWYVKAIDYIHGTDTEVAFVSTNSIVQGEQAGILGEYFLYKNIKINFAHRTFKWNTELKNDAQVYVIIIGLSYSNRTNKTIFDYISPDSESLEIRVKHINIYLLNQEDNIIKNRNRALCDVPEIKFGSMPNDKSYLLLTDEEREKLLSIEPKAEKWIKPFISAYEFLHNKTRWCLWLDSAKPSEIKSMPEVLMRVELVRDYRLSSKRAATVKLAKYPYLFGEIRQPDDDYILIPRHSSELREYIPMEFKSKYEIVSDSCCFISRGTLYHFGVLTSSMHMAWVRQICGRIKSDFRYSNKLVYNNFPWPRDVAKNNILGIEELVLRLLETRNEFSDESLSDLYDPVLMPKKLREIHGELDLAVEACYRRKSFKSEMDRINFLFALYKNYLNDEKKIK
ncbi:class I SAM-dependent DNA methyltransferase [Clostridium thailandense]|uniref:class I SAM-dependent DNA methyltransferase n=1 Tax=Clostridium thailandense TaxID=2794346 RepID=UPI00398966C5